MTRYLTLGDVDVAGKTVLVRSDLNVPLAGGEVSDDFRLRSALPTLVGLADAGAFVRVCSHLGRPNGYEPGLSLMPVAERLNEMTRYEVSLDEPADITVLENTRFLEGETANSSQAAGLLAAGCDLFVQDAFGSVHRAHASTVGVAEKLPSVAGPLLDRELRSFTRLTQEPERPFTIVLGGAKVSDKLGVVRELLPKVDRIVIGGGMCFTFLAAKGLEVGRSLVQDEMVDVVGRLLSGPDGRKIILPIDVAVGDSFSEDAERRVVDVYAIPPDAMGLDIGPGTCSGFRELITSARSVFWNGPMGVFEWESFRYGTDFVARAVAACDGFTSVGGGDTVAALRLLGLAETVDHLSTGGGAGLELLEGRVLPGVAVLEQWAR